MNAANKVLVWAFYGAYGLLLVWACVTDPGKAIPLLAVPAVGFVLVSAVRSRINAPRPYEGAGEPPRIERDGQGKSFPSRHAFSAFAIATCWFAASTPVAVVLLAAATALSVLRVRGGVHYLRDVVAGALCGVVFGVLALAAASLI